jgi:diacylglycerol kinase family enzyme
VEKVVILLNPSSGQGRSIRKKRIIEKIFRAKGIPYDLFVSESERDLRKMSIEVMHQYKDIIAVGGDTTFNIIASEILNHEIPAHPLPRLGIIGTGSANDVCRGLGIEKMESLCDCLVGEKIRKMDVGLVEISGVQQRYYFLGSMSAGLGPVVNQYVDQFNRKYRGLTRFTPGGQVLVGGMGVFKAFARKQVPLTLTLFSDQNEEKISFSLLVFLNTRYYANGLNLNDETSAFDGRIDCMALHTTSVWETLRFKQWLKQGLHRDQDGIRYLGSSWFDISMDTALDILLDGEIIRNVSKCRVAVLPGALEVFAP